MRVLLALLLLLLAGGVWLALKDGEGRGRRGERTGSALPEAEPEREPPFEAEPSQAETPGAAPLRGKIVMDHGRALLEVRAHVTGRGISEEVVRGEAQAGLPFEIDVAPLLAIERVEELELRVEHPDHLPARVRVAIPLGPVELTLIRAGIAQGKVVSEGGAEVAVFPLDGSGPHRRPVESVRTDAEGRYRLRVGGDGRYLVVALSAAQAPVQVPQDLWIGRIVEVPPLVLRDGAAITGRVTLRGGRPAADAKVRVRRIEDGRWLVWQNLMWFEGRLLRGNAQARTDAQGRYRLAGLQPGRHKVRCAGLEGAHPSVTQGREEYEREVDAPASGVDFEVTLSHLRLVLRGVPEAQILFSGSGHTMFATVEGSHEIGVAPGETYAIRVERKGFEPLRRKVTAPPERETKEVVLELQPGRPRATLLVTLRPAEGTVPAQAGFGLWRKGSTRIFPDVRNVTAEKGLFRLGKIDAGAYRLVVRPGGPWHGGMGHFLETETEVEVPGGGEVPVTLEIRRGGRLRIVARTPDGQAVEACCTIRNASGEKLDVWFFERRDAGWSSGTDSLGKGPTYVDPALPPGIYTIELSFKGYENDLRTVTVEAGATTVVEVKLSSAPD